MRLNTDFIGSGLMVPGFCELDNGDYDRLIEPLIRDKMIRFGVAKQSLNYTTEILITPFGTRVYQAGGWKKFLKSERDKKKKSDDEQLSLKRLEREKTELEMEKLIYEKKIRSLNEQVQKLTAINLKIQTADTVGKWFFGLAGLLVSFSASVFLEYQIQLVSKLILWITQILSSKG